MIVIEFDADFKKLLRDPRFFRRWDGNQEWEKEYSDFPEVIGVIVTSNGYEPVIFGTSFKKKKEERLRFTEQQKTLLIEAR